MNLNKWFLILAGLAFLSLFLMWQLSIVITFTTIVYILVMLGVGGGIAYASKTKIAKAEAGMEDAKDFSIAWWERNFHEMLQRKGSRGTKRKFEKDIFYAFRFVKRDMIGKALIIVEKKVGGYDVAEHVDDPEDKIWNNPWSGISGYLTGTIVDKPSLPEPISGKMWGKWSEKPSGAVNIYTQEKEFKKMEKEE